MKRGWADFVGPEATRLNNRIAIGSAIIGLTGAGAWAKRQGASGKSAVIMAVMAADLVGGAYVNNTRACVRWYERSGQGAIEHLAFAALHVHPAVVDWADRSNAGRYPTVVWAIAHYSYMILSTTAIRFCSPRRRSLGIALSIGGLLLDSTLGRSHIAPWFAWTYYPKLLMGHAAGSLWPDEEIHPEELPFNG